MQFQVAILTHVPSQKRGDIPQTKLLKIIRPIVDREQALQVAYALQPHVFPDDMLLIYDESTENKQVIMKYGNGELWLEDDAQAV